ncbi:High affinity cAMP-specific and IBMX-insensitive 3',5'-cyclic phosphodiesterase 9A [Boothiomyces macroporosus]|uniref:Phosphodiesterase n=1 Tax=Boothiomyces macroporosus TaxID=261099 RepID=A0AAD5Y4J7_9FUNG|nr:High affinity cAMP-specific and IBMX-insensitive 3',5'-cyclic phosphodiesterase 9A [Boothiomyces macroporosus]
MSVYCVHNEKEFEIELDEKASVPQVIAQLKSHVPDTTGDILKLYTSDGNLVPIGPHIPSNSRTKRYKLVTVTSETPKLQTTSLLSDINFVAKKFDHFNKFADSKYKKQNIVLTPAISRVESLVKKLRPFEDEKPVSFTSDVYERLKSVNFEVWNYDEDALQHFLLYFFVDMNFVAHFKLDRAVLHRFLCTVRRAYNKNPFHNFKHCFCVTQMVYVLLHIGELDKQLTMLEKFSLLISAVGHDLDHPGLNNAYQTNALTELAITYNDISPLENHHCAMLFSIFRHPELNILGTLSTQEYKDARKIIIGCILATDMGKHSECISKLREVGQTFKIDDPIHRALLIQTILKCADISNEVRPSKVSEPWVDCLLEEFFAQSDREKEEHLPFAPFMDRDKVTKPSAQVGFIGFVLLPLFDDTSKLVPELTPLIENIQRAKDYYMNAKNKRDAFILTSMLAQELMSTNMESTQAYLNMMPKLDSFTLDSSRQSRFFNDLDSNSSARVSQSSFAEYAGSLVSTIGSWDETEQDYDVKATREVTEMVEQLDNLLYKDYNSTIEAGEILDECQQWTLLFPHIRVCGIQMIPTKDSGYEIMSMQDARSSSPYFFLPAKPNDPHVIMQIQGHHIDSKCIRTAEDLISENDENSSSEWNLTSTIDWSDTVVREFIPRIQEFNVARWGVFKLLVEEDVHDRSSTPTPDHPHQEPRYENAKRYNVRLIKEGTGDIIAMRKTLESLAVYHSSNDLFALQSDQIGKSRNNSIIMHTWKSSNFPNQMNLHQITFDSQNSTFSFDFKLGLVDIMIQLKGLNVIEYQSPSFQKFFSKNQVDISHEIERRRSCLNAVEIVDGSVDEFFAFDSKVMDPKRPYSADSGNMVLESMKKDLIHSIFDDLWSEVYPKFQVLIDQFANSIGKLTPDIVHSVSQTPDNSSQIIHPYETPLEEDSEDDLLSAITIRPVPLQKRGSSSRVRSEISGIQPLNGGLTVLESRPTSAKPLQRPASARSNLSRPTSARPQDPTPLRAQLNMSKSGNTWKRGSTGFRLMPIVAAGQGGMNDMIHVTSLPLNQQKASTTNWTPVPTQSQHLGKKLPPIKGIMSSIDSLDIPKIQKHVNFDPTLDPTEVQKSVPSPRPFSARRQISSPFRTRTLPLSRPHTAISDRVIISNN